MAEDVIVKGEPVRRADAPETKEYRLTYGSHRAGGRTYTKGETVRLTAQQALAFRDKFQALGEDFGESDRIVNNKDPETSNPRPPLPNTQAAAAREEARDVERGAQRDADAKVQAATPVPNNPNAAVAQASAQNDNKPVPSQGGSPSNESAKGPDAAKK